MFTKGVLEHPAFDGQTEIDIGAAYFNSVVSFDLVDDFSLLGFKGIPFGNGVFSALIGVASSINEILIIFQAHPGLISVSLGWKQCGHPFEILLRAAPDLGAQDGSQGALSSGLLGRIYVRECLGVCLRMDWIRDSNSS